MRRPHASRATEWNFLNCASMGDSMKHKVSIYTLALLGALALAAISGGLLTTSDNVVYAADPEFDSNTTSRSVPENTPPGVNIGDPISATDEDEDGKGNDDLEYGDTLTYSLEARSDTDQSRAEAASFDIDESTGQLITKAPLDSETKASYSVTVTVDDGETLGNPVTQTVGITVEDVDEPPAAPVAPTVVSGEDDSNTSDDDESTTSLKVIWHEPENTGTSITDYDVEYKKTTDLEFSEWTHDIAATTATITGLEADTSYQVRVRAKNRSGINNAELEGPWSLSGVGSTNKLATESQASTNVAKEMRRR